MRSILVILCLCCQLSLFSQEISNAYHHSTNEMPLGMARYNTFTFLYTYVRGFGAFNTGKKYHYVGINNDGSVRFDVKQNTAQLTKPVQVLPTLDKGLISINQEFLCSAQNGYFPTSFTRLDSAAQPIFTFGSPNWYGVALTGIAQLSKTCFIASTTDQLLRINGNTGGITSTLSAMGGTITAIASNPYKQMAVAKTGSLCVVDSMGAILISKPTGQKYVIIKSYKNTYYMLDAVLQKIDRFDSTLNLTGTINGLTGIADYSIYNDTIVVATNSLNPGIGSYPVSSLSLASVCTNSITGHEIVSLVRGADLSILSAENRSEFTGYCGAPWNFTHENTVFYRRYFSNNINFAQDIVLKRLEIPYFEITSYWGTSISYEYQSSVVVQNNSGDTLKYFRLSHGIDYYLPGSSMCGGCWSGNAYDSEYSVNVPPQDSIEIQMPLLSAQKQTSAGENTFSITICVDLTSPNQSAENNVINSSKCETVPVYVGMGEQNQIQDCFLLTPNPAMEFLFFGKNPHNVNYEIYDTEGRRILLGNGNGPVDISTLTPGLYFFSLNHPANRVTRKFIKE